MGIDYLVIGAVAFLGLLALIGTFTGDGSYEDTTQSKGDNSDNYYEDDDDTESYAAMLGDSGSDHDEVTDPTYCYLSYNIYNDTCYADSDENTFSAFDSYYDDDHDDDSWDNCWDYDEYCWDDSDDWDD